MDETNTTRTDPTTERTTAAAPPRKAGGKGLLWGVIAVLLAFLAGFGWQYYRASTIQAQLEETQQELLVERVRVRLAQAAIAAQSGQFESARQQMSDLFGFIEQAGTELPQSVRMVGRDLLAMRDEIITGLSRSNPEYAGVLYGILDRLRAAVEAGGPDAPAEAEPPTATPDAAATDTAAAGAPEGR